MLVRTVGNSIIWHLYRFFFLEKRNKKPLTHGPSHKRENERQTNRQKRKQYQDFQLIETELCNWNEIFERFRFISWVFNVSFENGIDYIYFIISSEIEQLADSRNSQSHSQPISSNPPSISVHFVRYTAYTHRVDPNRGSHQLKFMGFLLPIRYDLPEHRSLFDIETAKYMQCCNSLSINFRFYDCNENENKQTIIK